VTEAWAGCFDGLLHRAVAAVTLRLAADCRAHGEGVLIPFGTVNPALPDWRDDVRRCVEEHGMPGVRLHPNYHGSGLDDPRFAAVLDEAAGRSLVVQLASAMEDPRTEHPLVRVPRVDLGPLPDLVAKRPTLRLVLLNVLFPPPTEGNKTMFRTGRVWADTGMLDGVAVIERFVAAFGADRLLLGSHAPFFCPDAVPLKLRESELNEADRAAVVEGNARALLGPA
jgi:predicted TIM-barrel fold metal-dependent hydrolase